MSRAGALARLGQQRVDVQRGAGDPAAAVDRPRSDAPQPRERGGGQQRGRARDRAPHGARVGAAQALGAGAGVGAAPLGRRAARGLARELADEALEHVVGRARLAARVDERGVPRRQRSRAAAASGRSRSAARGGSARASLNTCLVAFAACFLLPGKAIREPLRRTTSPPVSVNQILPLRRRLQQRLACPRCGSGSRRCSCAGPRSSCRCGPCGGTRAPTAASSACPARRPRRRCSRSSCA